MTAARSRGMHRVRWVGGAEPEMQCARCYEYLPLTLEYWAPIHGTARCRACWVETTRLSNRARRANPAYRVEERKAAKAQRDADRAAGWSDRRSYSREYYRRRYSTLAKFQREHAA